MKFNKKFWKDKKVFVTGHTGFKGAWLSIILSDLGSKVCGFALEPNSSPSLYNELHGLKNHKSIIDNIVSRDKLSKSIVDFKPEIIIHMAAQPLVRLSYSEPINTFDTNVVGTLNVLECCRYSPSVQVILNVTTDKVYENRGFKKAFNEEDKLGGSDPYSASKACSELVTEAYYRSFFQKKNVAVASARAGNVIGGGDWSEDRLIPDFLRSMKRNIPIKIRYPEATRPWQHVLEPLFGYLFLTEKLYKQPKIYSGAWNFGPDVSGSKNVKFIAESLIAGWPGNVRWEMDNNPNPYEASSLSLDVTKIRSLGVNSVWTIEEALSKVIDWHLGYEKNFDVLEMCRKQIKEFISRHEETDKL